MAIRRLAFGDALLTRFDAMTDGVPHQMHQRFGDQFSKLLVDADIAAHDFELDVLVELARSDSAGARGRAIQQVRQRHQA
jgi:hypothetical protein